MIFINIPCSYYNLDGDQSCVRHEFWFSLITFHDPKFVALCIRWRHHKNQSLRRAPNLFKCYLLNQKSLKEKKKNLLTLIRKTSVELAEEKSRIISTKLHEKYARSIKTWDIFTFFPTRVFSLLVNWCLNKQPKTKRENKTVPTQADGPTLNESFSLSLCCCYCHSVSYVQTWCSIVIYMYSMVLGAGYVYK